MKIRWKLLILLMLIALAPLAAATVIHNQMTRRLGGRLAADTREILTRDTSDEIESLVEHYGRLVQRSTDALELGLRLQVREVERRLAAPAPAEPVVYFSADYDKGERLPPGMTASALHRRVGADGQVGPVEVTYAQQAVFLAGGADRLSPAVAADLARLSTMAPAYRQVHGALKGIVYWQYTATETGVHTSYPGHGGYPADFDPRRRRWYVDAQRAGRLVWTPPLPDVTTRTVLLGLSAPVRDPAGRIVGVTGIDVPLTRVFAELKLPERLAGAAEVVLVLPAEAGDGGGTALTVLARRSDETRQDWRMPVKLERLASADAAGLAALAAAARSGRCGIREMPYRGEDALWAWGAGGDADQAFPVVIVPHEAVVARAVQAEQYVWRKVVQGLELSGAVMLAAVAVVTVVSLIASRRVTRPIRQLAAAAERLAGGDYDARADVRTGDELGALAKVFNDAGPKLKERESLKQSLALAMEIQQHLLPPGPPAIEGFDVAGACEYCDETGGDYYDFIQMVDVAPGRLGIAVGDVTGHGIGAALLMASARAVLRSHAGRYSGDLAALFAALNEHLVRDTGDDRFITLFVGVLDGPARSLTWASGGHDPALWLRRASGGFEEMPNTGVPLGIVEGAPFGQAGPVTIEPGDVIVVGTDGIWEASNPDREQFGKDRLRRVIAETADRPAAEIRAAVVAAVHAFRGSQPQADDITLVVIKAVTANGAN